MGLFAGGRWLRKMGLARPVAILKQRLNGFAVPFEVRVNGFHLVGATMLDAGYMRELLDGRESFMTETFVGSLRPGMRVVDAGAFLGFLSLQAARAVGPTGHVHAFEPNPRTFRLLEQNIRRNGFADRTTALCCALSDQAGARDFFITNGSDTSSLFRQEPSARRTVDSVRLDDLFADGRPCDVIKLDVEGAEVLALDGMAQTIERSRSRLFVECNPTALTNAGTSAEELVEKLRSLGLDIAVINEGSRELEPLRASTQVDPWVNLYCEPCRPSSL